MKKKEKEKEKVTNTAIDVWGYAPNNIDLFTLTGFFNRTNTNSFNPIWLSNTNSCASHMVAVFLGQSMVDSFPNSCVGAPVYQQERMTRIALSKSLPGLLMTWLDFKGNSHGFFPKREIYKSWNWHPHSIVPRRHSHQYITDGPCCHCFDLLWPIASTSPKGSWPQQWRTWWL